MWNIESALGNCVPHQPARQPIPTVEVVLGQAERLICHSLGILADFKLPFRPPFRRQTVVLTIQGNITVALYTVLSTCPDTSLRGFNPWEPFYRVHECPVNNPFQRLWHRFVSGKKLKKRTCIKRYRGSVQKSMHIPLPLLVSLLFFPKCFLNIDAVSYRRPAKLRIEFVVLKSTDSRD